MTNEILEALLVSWLETMAPADIARDHEKVVMLKRVAEEEIGVEPSRFVRDLYREVFLRDVWANERCAAGAAS